MAGDGRGSDSLEIVDERGRPIWRGMRCCSCVAVPSVILGGSERVSKVRGQATDALDGLEKVFQTRVHRALTQLGVPSAEEVQSLSKRVDRLNANIDKLARGRKPGATARGNGRRRGQRQTSATAA